MCGVYLDVFFSYTEGVLVKTPLKRDKPVYEDYVVGQLALKDCTAEACISIGPQRNAISTATFASVGLRVSVSHDLGEIACGIACNLMMQFDDAICRNAIYGYAICALEMREMRQSMRVINACISHQWMAPQSISSPRGYSSLSRPPTPIF